MPVTHFRRYRMSCVFLMSCVVFGGLIAAGCAAPQPVDVETEKDGSHSMLAAARAHQIRMFGEIGDDENGKYFTRSALSLRQHTFTEIGGDFDPDVDSQGRRIVFASTRHNTKPDLYVKSVQGVAVTQLTSDPAGDVQPAFSPDDTKVAFASDRGGNWDLWIIGIDGGQPIQVTSTTADEMHPSWSPDGTKLVYCSLPEGGGQWELWVVDAVASGTPRFIGYGLFPQWSPVDNTILFQRARERGSRWFSVWTLTLIDGEPRYPTELAASAHHAMILPTWSPDGRLVAFASTESVPAEVGTSAMAQGAFDIWMMNADGGGKARLTDGYTLNYAPVFSPDGRIYFTSSRLGYENVWSLLPAGPSPAGSGGDIVTRGSVDDRPVPTTKRRKDIRTAAETVIPEEGWNSGVSDERTSPN